MELLIPDSWGSPLSELNTCHGKGRGHPCLGPKATPEQARGRRVGEPATGPLGRQASGRPVPIHTEDVKEAVQLILQGKVVELGKVKQVHTVLKRLAKIAREAVKLGEKAPSYNLCNVSVKGTNLFCAESLGVPRIKMPQLKTAPMPGTEAAELELDSRGRVDATEAFLVHLAMQGIGTNKEKVPASFLRASQNELVGAQIAEQATTKGYKARRIIISRDNYILDGHHKWASMVGIDTKDNELGNLKMKVTRVDAPISELLHLANRWTKQFGLAPKAGA